MHPQSPYPPANPPSPGYAPQPLAQAAQPPAYAAQPLGYAPQPAQFYPQSAPPVGVASPAAGIAEYAYSGARPGWGRAFSLYWQTIGCTARRALTTFVVNGVAFGLLALAIAASGVGAYLGGTLVAAVALAPFLIAAVAWLFFTSGWVFRTYVGHVAVLAELIVHGKVDGQGKGLAAHGAEVANEVFGSSEGVAGVQRNFDHVLGTAQDAITSAVSWLPGGLARFLFSFIRRVRAYLAWVMVSYVFATRRPGRQRGEVDTVVLHAFAQSIQSWKKLLPCIMKAAFMEGVLVLPVWVLAAAVAFGGWFAASYAITGGALAGSGAVTTMAGASGVISLIVAVLVAAVFGSITTVILVSIHRDLFARPLCLIRAMLDFHAEVASRPFDRSLVERVSRLEDLAETLHKHASSASSLGGAASGALGLVKGFMGD